MPCYAILHAILHALSYAAVVLQGSEYNAEADVSRTEQRLREAEAELAAAVRRAKDLEAQLQVSELDDSKTTVI